MNSNDRSGGGFSGGFLVGLFIGGVIVFLLGTKRGKKLLKIILDEGLDGFSRLLEKVDKGIDLDNALDGEDFSFSDRSVDFKPQENESLSHREINTIEEPQVKPRVKRFFKGISRRLN